MNKKQIFYRQQSIYQPENVEKLKEITIKSWLFYSIINTIIFLPLLFWMMPLYVSIRIKKFIKTEHLVEASELSREALFRNLFVTAFGIITYAWLIPLVVYIILFKV